MPQVPESPKPPHSPEGPHAPLPPVPPQVHLGQWALPSAYWLLPTPGDPTRLQLVFGGDGKCGSGKALPGPQPSFGDVALQWSVGTPGATVALSLTSTIVAHSGVSVSLTLRLTDSGGSAQSRTVACAGSCERGGACHQGSQGTVSLAAGSSYSLLLSPSLSGAPLEASDSIIVEVALDFTS